MDKENLGRYQLRQMPGVFPLGRDSLLLGEFTTVRQGWRVCDLGCGSGVLLLLLAQRAETVIRVCCGLPQALKGELL